MTHIFCAVLMCEGVKETVGFLLNFPYKEGHRGKRAKHAEYVVPLKLNCNLIN
jgi:hypothetical protein